MSCHGATSKCHVVTSCLDVLRWRHVGVARLTMRDFSDSYLDDYLARNWDSIRWSVGGYKIEEDDIFRWDPEEATQVYLALGFAVLLIYMVTAALFESLAAPFVVLLTLPLALIGVFLIFFYTGIFFNICF